MLLRKWGYSFLKIQDIFISHLHGDHIFGIFGLLSTMSMMGRRSELRIYAPAEFSQVLELFMKHFGEMFKYEIVHKVLKPDGMHTILEGRKIKISSFPLNHRVDCYGFRFDEKAPMRNVYKNLVEEYKLTLGEIAALKIGEDVAREGITLDNARFTYMPYKARSFAYCSDTAPYPDLVKYIYGCNMIYHEATFGNDMIETAHSTMHSTASDAAVAALQAGASRLIIGHFSSRYKNIGILLEEAREIFPESYIAEEGLAFEIPLEGDN